MFCTTCGAKNPDDANFCVQCGAKMQSNGVLETSIEDVEVEVGDFVFLAGKGILYKPIGKKLCNRDGELLIGFPTAETAKAHPGQLLYRTQLADKSVVDVVFDVKMNDYIIQPGVSHSAVIVCKDGYRFNVVYQTDSKEHPTLTVEAFASTNGRLLIQGCFNYKITAIEEGVVYISNYTLGKELKFNVRDPKVNELWRAVLEESQQKYCVKTSSAPAIETTSQHKKMWTIVKFIVVIILGYILSRCFGFV